jgi:hypothetical protein
MGPHHRRQTYYGYAFESYCTTSTPGHREDASSHVPGWGGDVNTNVQWCSVVKTKLGDRRIVIGGEVDCVRGMLSKSSFLVADSTPDCLRYRKILWKYRKLCRVENVSDYPRVRRRDQV